MRSVSRIAVIVLGTFGSLIYLFLTADLGIALKAAGQIPPIVTLAATAALIAGLLLSGVRFRLALRGLGLHIGYRLAMHANLLGIIGGLLFFSIIGQTLARASVLKRHGIGGPAVLLANVYERATALLSLGLLALAAALFLFGKFTFDLAGGGDASFVKLVLGLMTVGAVVLPGLDRRLLRRAAQGVIPLTRIKAIANTSLMSVLVHGTTLLAFILLGHSVNPNVAILPLAAASVIVMFAAALPISFAGWGVRELGAIHALGQIGFTTSDALAVSIMVGILSLVGLGLLAIRDAFVEVPEKARGSGHSCRETVQRQSLGIARATSWIVPLLAGALVPFQVYVPAGSSLINVNLADPIAIAGGFVFLTLYAKFRDGDQNWRIQWFEAGVVAAVITIVFGFLNGAAHFGITDWALYNRTIGFLILLSYVATGALIVGAGGRAGLQTLLAVLVSSCVAIAGIDIALSIMRTYGLPVSAFLINNEQIAGMAQNPNAFALQIALALAATIALSGRLGSGKIWRHLPIAVLPILVVAILVSNSRAGYACGIAVVSAAMWLGALGLRTAVKTALSVLLFFAVLAAPQRLPSLIDGWGTAATPPPRLESTQPSAQARQARTAPSTRQVEVMQPALSIKSTEATSDAERRLTIERGLEMWMTSPVFGAGLGAFRHQIQVETGKPLVIHNTTVWMLAELGLSGTIVFLALFLMISRTAWRERQTHSVANIALLLTLLVFGVSQLVHDVMYQRVFWLLFGATLFTGRFRPWKSIAA